MNGNEPKFRKLTVIETGFIIKIIRTELKLNQETLATIMGHSERHWQRIENGEVKEIPTELLAQFEREFQAPEPFTSFVSVYEVPSAEEVEGFIRWLNGDFSLMDCGSIDVSKLGSAFLKVEEVLTVDQLNVLKDFGWLTCELESNDQYFLPNLYKKYRKEMETKFQQDSMLRYFVASACCKILNRIMLKKNEAERKDVRRLEQVLRDYLQDLIDIMPDVSAVNCGIYFDELIGIIQEINSQGYKVYISEKNNSTRMPLPGFHIVIRKDNDNNDLLFVLAK